MKKAKFQGKLSLKKETVARLNDAQLNDVKGGSIYDVVTRKCYVVTFTKTIPPSCTITTDTTYKNTIIDKSDIVVFQ